MIGLLQIIIYTISTLYKGRENEHSARMSSLAANNQQIVDLNTTVKYLYKYVVPVIFIVGNIGNLLSILIFSKKSWRKNVCVFYFKIVILFNTCYLNSIGLGTIFIHGFHISLHNSSSILCKSYIYTSFLFFCLSPTVLILAFIDRLLISSQNIDTRLYSSKRLAYFSLSIGTCIWVIFNIHILVMFNIKQIVPTVVVCLLDSSRIYTDFVTYFYSVMNVVFCLVMIILCVLSFKNVRRIRTVPREKRNQQIRKMNKKDFQLLRCLFVQGLVNVVLSMPFLLLYIYQAVTRDIIRTPFDQALLTFLNRLFTVLYIMYYASTFFIFAAVSRAFRHELKSFIWKIVGKEVIPIREEENQPTNIVIQDNVEMNTIPTIVL